MAVVLAFTGFLMVSSIPYANLKKLSKRSADKKHCLALLLLLSLSFLFLGSAAPLFLFSLYILSGLLRFDWEQWLMLPEARNQEAVSTKSR